MKAYINKDGVRKYYGKASVSGLECGLADIYMQHDAKIYKATNKLVPKLTSIGISEDHRDTGLFTEQEANAVLEGAKSTKTAMNTLQLEKIDLEAISTTKKFLAKHEIRLNKHGIMISQEE